MTFEEALQAAKNIDDDKQLIAAFGYDDVHKEYYCVNISHSSDPDSLAYSLIYQADQIPESSMGVFTHEAEDTIELLKESTSFLNHAALQFSIYDVPSIEIYEMNIEWILRRIFPTSFNSIITALRAA